MRLAPRFDVTAPVASECLADFDILNVIYVHSQVSNVKRCVTYFRSESKEKYKGECYGLKLRLKFWFITSAARASTICKVVSSQALFCNRTCDRRSIDFTVTISK